MTQTLELTASELALIENARKQEILNQEVKALQKAAKMEKETIEMEAYIKKEQGGCNEQVAAAKKYAEALQKLNPKYKLAISQAKKEKTITEGYGDEKVILKEFRYVVQSARILLEDSPYEIAVNKHYIYSRSYGGKNKDMGYKMLLTGGGFYNERLISNPKTLNEKIENKKRLEINKTLTALKKKTAVESVLNLLKTQYPDAMITLGSEWQRNEYSKNREGQTIDTLTIILANKVKMKLRVYEDQSIGRMETTFPVKNNYQFIEVMNGLSFPE
jgi:hypothetical protein